MQNPGRTSLVVITVISLLAVGALSYWTLADEPPGHTRRSVPRQPNVLLISIDTLRADHLSAYGYPRPTSPAIAALAERGVLFTNAYSHSPKTATSHMSIMTGLLPEAHGVEQWDPKGSARLSDDIPTLATLLKQHGYATLAITGGGHVRAELGFDQGMDSIAYIDDVVATFAQLGQRITAHVAQKPEQPFFAFAHTYRAHDPYVPAPPYRTLFTDPAYSGRIISSYDELTAAAGSEWLSQHDLYWSRVDPDNPRDIQQLKDLYDGAIRWTDDQIAALVGHLGGAGILNQTLVIVLADHGEEFGDHGRFQHEQIYQELLHVPLVMVFPERNGRTYHGREDAVVRLIDILPTVLDYLGLPVPAHLQGVSLMALLAGGAPPPREVMSSWREGGLRSLRVDDAKLIQVGIDGAITRRELYRLAADPNERNDRAQAETAVRETLATRMNQLVADGKAVESRCGAVV